MSKRIIICCDGTWNNLEMRYITNVGRLVQALTSDGPLKHKSVPQVVFYDDGVGADENGLERAMQGGVGWGIDNLIYEAYRFICMNWEKGDELCMFGFSRGAFTVRSVAGMIGKVGLVKKSHLKEMPRAMEMYRNKDDDELKAFRASDFVHKNVVVDLLGCWDTVGALGVPDKLPWLPLDNWLRKRYQFHDTTLGTHIKRAIHAVALDERRKEFDVTPMKKSDNAPGTQKLVETWFPGDHGSVGGGTWEKRALSNTCLTWMMETADKLGVKLGVDFSKLHDNCMTDPSIHFSINDAIFYSDTPRDIKSCTIKDFHPSVAVRWHDLGKIYRPGIINGKLRDEIEKWKVPGTRTQPSASTRLEVGESRDVLVMAKNKHGASGLVFARGEKYEVEVSRVQVWKDGDFDACDVLGWNTQENKETGKKARPLRPPFKKGKEVEPGSVKHYLIRSASTKKLVPHANWFELVYSLDGENYDAFNFPLPKKGDRTTPYRAIFTAKKDGNLILAANDLYSKFDLIDKYDNNRGWVWVKVIRKK